MMMTVEFHEGETVTINGKRGQYIVYHGVPNRDGSIVVYGGSMNPNAVRMFRNVMPANLKHVPKKRARKGA